MVGGQRKKERVQQRRPRRLRPPGRLVDIPSGWASSEGWDGRGCGDALRRLHAGCGHNPALQVDGSTQIGITHRPSRRRRMSSLRFRPRKGDPRFAVCFRPQATVGCASIPRQFSRIQNAPSPSDIHSATRVRHCVKLSASFNPTPNPRCRRNQGRLTSKSLTIWLLLSPENQFEP